MFIADRILNISVGMKTIGAVISNWLYLYAGLGIDLGIVFVKNKIHCVTKETQHKTYLGMDGVAKSGAQIFFNPTLYLSAFADYLYLPVSMHYTVDVGGLKVGGG